MLHWCVVRFGHHLHQHLSQLFIGIKYAHTPHLFTDEFCCFCTSTLVKGIQFRTAVLPYTTKSECKNEREGDEVLNNKKKNTYRIES